jgi:hypothetical protein
MKKILYLLCMLFSFAANAQVKIGDNPTTINGSSLLELESSSSNKGLLLPRISLTNTTTWGLVTNTPVNGMIVYNTSTSITSSNISYPIIPGGAGVYYWDGTGWVASNPSSANGNFWNLSGNAGTNSATNFLGTTDNHALKLKVNGQMAGFIDSTSTKGNLFLGLLAGASNARAATMNTFIGIAAGATTNPTNATTPADGFKNSALGYNALALNSTGYENTALGYITMQQNSTGIQNTAVGSQAMAAALGGNFNTALGYKALQNSTTASSNNTALGYWAMGNNNYTNSGFNNVAVGSFAYNLSTSGNNNVAVGAQALSAATGATNNNVSIGSSSMSSFTGTGGNNTAVGSSSGGTLTTGSNNTFLGYTTALSNGTLTNATAVGANAYVAQNNSMVLGSINGVNGATANTSVGIGTTTPNSSLQVSGSVSTAIVTVTGSYTFTSADYTVIFTGSSSAPTFTLPDPTTCKGRMYRLVNASSTSNYQDIALSRPVYYTSGQSSSVLSINTFTVSNGLADPTVGNTTIIQSDGNIWWRIGL